MNLLKIFTEPGKNKGVIAGIVGGLFFGGAALAYYSYKKELEVLNDPKHIQELERLEQNERDEEFLSNVKRAIIDQLSKGGPGILPPEIIAKLYQFNLQAIKHEYIQLLRASREERRKHLNVDMKKYEEHVLKHDDDLENLVIGQEERVFQRLGMPIQLWEQSFQYMLQRDPQFHYLPMLLLKEIRREFSVVPLSILDTEMLRKVLQFQIETYPKIAHDHVDPAISSMVVSDILTDLVYQQFGLEEEDIWRVPKTEITPEIKELIDRLQETINGSKKGKKAQVSNNLTESTGIKLGETDQEKTELPESLEPISKPIVETPEIALETAGPPPIQAELGLDEPIIQEVVENEVEAKKEETPAN